MLLGGCAGGGYDPAAIRPVYVPRNSPSPVPVPRRKPSLAAVQARAREASGGRTTVTAGQTLYGISRIYGVPLRDLISTNGLRAPYTISVGQTLRLPSPGVYTVKRGDTGYSISRRFGVTVSSLMRVNRIGPPYTLSIGQTLRLPGGAAETSFASASKPPSRSSRPPSGTTRQGPRAKPTPPQSSERVTTPRTPPPRTSSRFAWPTTGRLASRFGPKEGGLHNDGINILARAGSPVKAAEDGVVVYASNALQGYGNLLLIKHADGYITAYAHNERLLVPEGKRVKRGEVIARVGRSGGVSEPQLHFEIRRGRRALDPLSLLERQTAALLP